MNAIRRFFSAVSAPFNIKSLTTDEVSKVLLDELCQTDIIEATIGCIGIWQIQVYASLFIMVIPSAWVKLGIELYAHKTSWWCKSTDGNSTNSTCPCPNGYEYDLSLTGGTIISDWDLVCDRENLITVIQTVTMLGAMFGGMVFGLAANKYGRRKALIVSTCLRFLCGVLSSIAKNVTQFGTLTFFLAFFDGGISPLALIITGELLCGKWGVFLSVFLGVAFSLGFSVMGFVSFGIQDWRYAQIVLYVISLVTVLCAFLIPESPKWLLEIDKKSEAIGLLEEAAKTNGLNPSMVRSVVSDNVPKLKRLWNWTILFKRELRGRTFLCAVNGIMVSAIADGYLQYFGEFGHNPIADLNIQAGSTAVGTILAGALVATYTKPCFPVLVFLIVALCSFIGLVSNVLKTACSIVILFCLAIAVAASEPFIERLFPKSFQIYVFWIFKLSAELGAVFAPIVVYVNVYGWYLPSTVILLLSLVEILFLLLLPKRSRLLPDEDFGEELK